MKKCPRCRNTVFGKDGLCSYCIWKGDEGPGKKLRLLLKSLTKTRPRSKKP